MAEEDLSYRIKFVFTIGRNTYWLKTLIA